MSLKNIISKRNRAILSELVRTDFKLRYQGSVIGYAWSLLRPLIMFAILYVVFVKVFPLGKGVPHFPVYLFTGIIIWNFFTEMTQQSVTSIVARGDLIRKIKIPRWLIVMTSSISSLINLGLNSIVLMLFMIFNGVSLLPTLVWAPLILLEVYIFSLGISLILAAAFVKFRDLNYIWELILQAGFYLTPILYPLTQIANTDYQKLLLMNPMAQTIQDMRYSIISHDASIKTIHSIFSPNDPAIYIPFAIVILTLIVGVWYFRNQMDSFAENL